MNEKRNRIVLCILIFIGISLFGIFSYLFVDKTGLLGKIEVASSSVDEYGGGGFSQVENDVSAKHEPTQKPSERPVPSPTAKPTPAPTEIPTQNIVTEPPRQTERPSDNAQQGSGFRLRDTDLIEFRDEASGLSCLVPSRFVSRDKYTDFLYVAESKDGFSTLMVNCESAMYYTPMNACNEFISELDGEVVLKNISDTEYEALIHTDSKACYKYCAFYEDNMYWFVFIYPITDESVYLQYINAIKDSFIVF